MLLRHTKAPLSNFHTKCSPSVIYRLPSFKVSRHSQDKEEDALLIELRRPEEVLSRGAKIHTG